MRTFAYIVLLLAGCASEASVARSTLARLRQVSVPSAAASSSACTVLAEARIAEAITSQAVLDGEQWGLDCQSTMATAYASLRAAHATALASVRSYEAGDAPLATAQQALLALSEALQALRAEASRLGLQVQPADL